MTPLENQLAEALEGFMLVTETGIGIKNMNSFSGRTLFYEKLSEVRLHGQAVLETYRQQQTEKPMEQY